jgi:tetratricopeptide (TPR) repeat protein
MVLVLAGCAGPGEKNPEVEAADTGKIILARLNSRIAEDAANPDLYNERANYYLIDHQFDNALKDVNKAISIDPKNPDYYITLSDIYLLMGQPQNTNDILLKALALDENNTRTLIKLAKLSLILKKHKETYGYVKRLLVIDEINPSAHYIRAIALLEQGDTTRAVEDLKKSIDQDQTYYEAYLQLGELYAMKKNPMAADYLKNALTIRPQSKEAYYMLGMFYQETGVYDKALETYQKLAMVDTSFRNPPYNAGYIYLVYLKDFPMAVKLFTEALKRDPAYYEAIYNRGLAYELMGNDANAREDYQRVLKIEVNYDKAIEALNRLDKVTVRN